MYVYISGGGGGGRRVCTRRTGNDTLPPVLSRQMRHLVVGPTHLKAEHWLEVLTLHEDLVTQSVCQVDGAGERSHFDDIVDPRCENESQILWQR